MHFHAAAAPGRKEVRIVYNFLVNLTGDSLGMSSCFWSLQSYATEATTTKASEPSGKQRERMRQNWAEAQRLDIQNDGRRRQLWSPYYKYYVRRRKCIVEQESLAWWEQVLTLTTVRPSERRYVLVAQQNSSVEHGERIFYAQCSVVATIRQATWPPEMAKKKMRNEPTGWRSKLNAKRKLLTMLSFLRHR